MSFRSAPWPTARQRVGFFPTSLRIHFAGPVRHCSPMARLGSCAATIVPDGYVRRAAWLRHFGTDSLHEVYQLVLVEVRHRPIRHAGKLTRHEMKAFSC